MRIEGEWELIDRVFWESDGDAYTNYKQQIREQEDLDESVEISITNIKRNEYDKIDDTITVSAHYFREEE